MASKSVVILLPNARRKSIKVKTNTTIAEIVDNICDKEQLNSSFYSLRYQRKILEESNTFLHSNLPNNVLLELVKLEKPKSENQVKVALQISDGSRLQNSFSSATSLWDIIQYWESQRISKRLPSLLATEINRVISCVYMHQEISGRSALQQTFLRSLGLVGGSAIIRLNYREATDEENNEHNRGSDSSSVNCSSGTKVNETNIEQKFAKVPPDHPSDLNLMSPHGSSHPHLEVIPQESAITVASIATDSQASRPTVNTMGTEQHQTGIKKNPDDGARDPKKWIADGSPVDEHVKRRKIDENVACNVIEAVDAIEDIDLCPVVYHLDDLEIESNSETYSEDFYEVTVDDIKQMLQGLHYTKSFYDNKDQQILMTRDLRDKKALENAQNYNKAVIRFYFPDKFVVQAFFKVSAKVLDIEEFVKSTLKDANMPFYLYTTPPKKILNKKDMKLYQAGLVPKSIVHIGCDLKPESYLAPHYLDLRVNPNSSCIKDTTIRKSCASTSGIGNATRSNKSRLEDSEKIARTSEKQQMSSKGTEDRKLPKWFQIGKK